MRAVRLAAFLLVAAGLGVGASEACPFCAAVKLTFREEIRGAQAAILAKIQRPQPERPPATEGEGAVQPPPTTFEIVQVLKGQEIVGDKKTVEVLYFGETQGAQTYLLIGIQDPTLGLQWGAPTGLSEEAEAYVRKVMALPDDRIERLPHIFPYLQHPETTINQDAYDEFAIASYDEVKAIKPHLDREQLKTWIRDPATPASRKRLYLTLLGVAGTADDLPMLEEMIRSDDKEQRRALDALVACYLTLKGPEGLPLVEELFLKNENAEYTDTYATIMALRFHGQEGKVIPKERLAESMRLMLARPKLADLVIPDLARWEDWSVVEPLTKLFVEANQESNWVRVPVLQYLKACPTPEAKEALDKLSKLDPDAAKRASNFLPIDRGPSPNETRAGAAETAGAPPAEAVSAAPAPESKPVDAPPAAAEAAPPAPASPSPATPVEGPSPSASASSGWSMSMVPLAAGSALLILALVTFLLLSGGRPKSSS